VGQVDRALASAWVSVSAWVCKQVSVLSSAWAREMVIAVVSA
jgi:hypothetical protein